MKLMVGRTIGRHVEVGHAECMTDLALECERKGIDLTRSYVKGDALVSRSRSMLASSFLRSDCDVLLSIDGDIEFQPSDAIKIAEECAGGRDVIGAMYMTRSLNTQPALMLPDGWVTFEPGAEPVTVPFLSTGFLATHRRVFEDLRADLPHCHQTWRVNGQDSSFWPFYMPYCIDWPDDGFLYLSEDWAFCERAKSHGYPLWLDPSIRLGHVGEYRYTLEDLFLEHLPAQPIRLHRDPDGTLHKELAIPAGTAS